MRMIQLSTSRGMVSAPAIRVSKSGTLAIHRVFTGPGPDGAPTFGKPWGITAMASGLGLGREWKKLPEAVAFMVAVDDVMWGHGAEDLKENRGIKNHLMAKYRIAVAKEDMGDLRPRKLPKRPREWSDPRIVKSFRSAFSEASDAR